MNHELKVRVDVELKDLSPADVIAIIQVLTMADIHKNSIGISEYAGKVIKPLLQVFNEVEKKAKV